LIYSLEEEYEAFNVKSSGVNVDLGPFTVDDPSGGKYRMFGLFSFSFSKQKLEYDR
jgi:hypothetical protein